MKFYREKYTIANTFFLSFKAAPFSISISLFLTATSGLITPLQVIFVARFIDSVQAYLNGSQSLNKVVLSILLICTLQVYGKISQILMDLLGQYTENQFKLKIDPLILKKRAALQYRYVEDHDIWNLVLRVMSNSGFQQIVDSNLKIIRLTMQIGGIFAIIVSQIWWSAIVIFVISIPLMIVSVQSGKVLYDMDKKVAVLTRLMNYYASILTNREAAAERLLFSYTDRINEKFKRAHKERTDTNLRTITSGVIRTKISGLILILFGIFIMIILLNPVSTGKLTVGMYISIIGSLMGILNGFSEQLGMLLQDFSRIKEYLKEFTQFMHLDECAGVLSDGETHYIDFEYLEFKNVSFKYPGTEKYIIKDLNLRIEKGKHYAFVGTNGAGKTTIIKLITRLYDAQEGEIILNGKNIKDYPYKDLASLYGIVYQDFAKYYISLKDNITFGDDKDIGPAVAEAGLDSTIHSLAGGSDTQLGKIDEGGIDLSGGEWQKLAIARAIYTHSSFKILDEPTAALSPTSENEIYKKFDEITKNETTLLVTHRLGSTKLADEILVFDKGKLIEQGTHKCLMMKRGMYCTMFESQRKWYDDQR